MCVCIYVCAVVVHSGAELLFVLDADLHFLSAHQYDGLMYMYTRAGNDIDQESGQYSHLRVHDAHFYVHLCAARAHVRRCVSRSSLPVVLIHSFWNHYNKHTIGDFLNPRAYVDENAWSIGC